MNTHINKKRLAKEIAKKEKEASKPIVKTDGILNRYGRRKELALERGSAKQRRVSKLVVEHMKLKEAIAKRVKRKQEAAHQRAVERKKTLSSKK